MPFNSTKKPSYKKINPSCVTINLGSEAGEIDKSLLANH